LGEWFRKSLRSPGPESAPVAEPSQPPAPARGSLNLQREYEEMVRNSYARYGINPSEMHIGAMPLGYSGGREVYGVFVTASNDDALTAMLLTFLAPTIQRKVADICSAKWISDYTKFAGVWSHWPAHVPIPDEIHALLRNRRKAAVSTGRTGREHSTG
jgi:hypothetical protein